MTAQPKSTHAESWIKAIVTYRKIPHLVSGLPLTLHLQSKSIAYLLYFAHYTSKPYRLEIQMLTSHSRATIFKTIMDYRYQKIKPLGIRFEKCTGSRAHAHAFNAVVSLLLHNQLTPTMLSDVAHFLFNMGGMSYLQEAMQLNSHVHTILKNVLGEVGAPCFAPKLMGSRTR